MNFHLSQYATNPYLPGTAVWRHNYTGESLGLSKTIQKILPRLLEQSLDMIADTPEGLLHQLIAAELADRGFLIPAEWKENEKNYLDSLHCLSKPRVTFFNSIYAHVHSVPETARWVFLGAPCDLGGKNPGSRFGPDLLREFSLGFAFRGATPQAITSLDKPGGFLSRETVFDIGNIHFEDQALDHWLQAVTKTIQAIPPPALPILIGGDHSLTLGAVRGMMRRRGGKPFTYVQIDQHLDVQAWGHFSDGKPDPLDPPRHSNFVSHLHREFPQLPIYHLGIRKFQSIDPMLQKDFFAYLSQIGKQWTDYQLLFNSAENLGSQIGKGKEIYLSIDVDVLQALLVGNTGYPAYVGVDFKTLLALLTNILQNNRLVGLDIMEFGSSWVRDAHRQGAQVVLYLLLHILEQCVYAN